MLASVELALAFVPRWVLLAAGLGAAVVLGGGWAVEHTSTLVLREDLATQQAKIDGERAANAVGRALDSERERAKEKKWADEARQTQEAFNEEIARLSVARAVSDAAASRMRDTITIALRTIRSTGRNSTPAEVGTAADALAGVLRESLAEYRAMGADAANSAAHGTQCERTYDSLTTTSTNVN